MSEEKTLPKIDILTLAAISALAWISVDILHEIAGHAGAAALLGIDVHAVSTSTAYIEWNQISSYSEYRIIHAAGTVLNLLTGFTAILLLKSRKYKNKTLNCYLWLFSTISMIVVTMNLISAPLIGGGDWTEFTVGFVNRDILTGVIVGAGILLSIPGYLLPLRYWMSEVTDDRRTLVKLTLIPVVTIIAVQTISMLESPFAGLSPERNHLLASTFAFLHFILWAILVNIIPVPKREVAKQSVILPRSYTSIGLAVIVTLFFIVILGPGLGPLENDPRLVKIN